MSDCARCGVDLDTAGSHYHCGHCHSPLTTSMLGHWLNGQYTCDAHDMVAAPVGAE